MTNPLLFIYHPIFGYFPGPIYDDVIPMTPSLILSRGLALITSLLFLLLSGLLVNRRAFFWDVRKISPGGWLLTLCGVLMILALLSLAHLYEGNLRLFISRDDLQKELGGRWETEHFTIFFPEDSPIAQEILLIALDHEFRYDQVSRFLQVKLPRKINSYIYSTPDQKKELMGAKHTDIGDPINHEIHLNYEYPPSSVLKHELTHVLSAHFGNPLFFNASPKVGLVEGLAVAVEWQDGALTPHQWSKGMIDLGLAPDIERVLGAIGFWSESSSRSYTLTGSFIRYLVDTYEIDQFKSVYRWGTFEKTYGKSLGSLAEEWRQFLARIDLSPQELQEAKRRFSAPSIFQRKCPHETARLNEKGWEALNNRHYPKAVKFFQEVYDTDRRPASLGQLLRAYSAMADYPRALEVAETILSDPASDPSLLTSVKNTQGDIHWQLGQKDRAVQIFQELREGIVAPDLERLISVKLEALKFPSIEQDLKPFLLTQERRDIRLLILKEAIGKEPNFFTGYYLLGRQLYLTKAFDLALPYFRKAEQIGLPSQALTIENLKLLATSLFYERQYGEAAEVFTKILQMQPAKGVVNELRDWIERCRWYQEKTLDRG